MIVKRAVEKLPDHEIGWAVINRHSPDPNIDGWDYHLIKTEWGYGNALRFQSECGGWILTL
jgi:hypothetical protein